MADTLLVDASFSPEAALLDTFVKTLPKTEDTLYLVTLSKLALTKGDDAAAAILGNSLFAFDNAATYAGQLKSMDVLHEALAAHAERVMVMAMNEAIAKGTDTDDWRAQMRKLLADDDMDDAILALMRGSFESRGLLKAPGSDLN